MVKRAWVLALTLLPAVAAGGAEPSTPPAAPTPDAPVAPPRPPLVERFRFFSLTPLPLPVLDLSGLPDEKRLFHQQGDPDSLFTLGDPTPGGQVHLQAAIEINELSRSSTSRGCPTRSGCFTSRETPTRCSRSAIPPLGARST